MGGPGRAVGPGGPIRADDGGGEGLVATVDRLRRTMLLLALVPAAGFAMAADGRALVVLTLTVAAAIVQLRWLASQVVSLSTLAAGPAEHGAGGPGEQRQRPRVAAHGPGPPQGPSSSAAENEATAEASDAEPAVTPGSQRIEAFDTEAGPQARLSKAELEPRDQLQAQDGSDQEPGDPGGERHEDAVGRRGALLALTRWPVLLGAALLLLAVGVPEPLALAAGALTLPGALLVETVRSAIGARSEGRDDPEP